MKILIIKIGALGDVLRTSFIAQALKEKYKKANPKIYWITDKKAAPLFINSPYVDQIISNENKEKIKDLFFDLVINLEEDEESCKFVSFVKHKKLTGAFINKEGKVDYTKDSAHWFDMSIISKLGKKEADFLKTTHKNTHKELMAKIIGTNPEKYEPFLRLTNHQRKMSTDFLRRNNLSKENLIIGINTGAADRWPKALSVKKTAELIDKLYKKFNAHILIFGGPNETDRNKKIINLSKSPIIDTGCGNNLIEFPALISLCHVFITTDSLGLHAALSLKRRTICLIGPTLPNEIEMYGHGDKVIAKSKCIACLKKNCKSMEKIDLKEIIYKIEKLLSQKITIIITAYKEPHTISKAIEAALNQKTHHEYDIVVSAPDKETLNIAQKYARKNKKVRTFQDPGKGKSLALNLLFEKIDSDILVLTDGDVWITNNSLEEIYKLFLDPEVGCVTGRPSPLENKKNKYGYWANFLFESAHRLRKEAGKKNSFIECSGYLFAFRKNKIRKIPLDTAEDTIIPYYLWEKGYKIDYADKALVYVKNVDNWKDWINQKTRTSKAHETLENYADTKTTPRVKSFKNELKGIFWLMKYPSKFIDISWSVQLLLARFYMWTKVMADIKIQKSHYQDSWERIESTK